MEHTVAVMWWPFHVVGPCPGLNWVGESLSQLGEFGPNSKVSTVHDWLSSLLCVEEVIRYVSFWETRDSSPLVFVLYNRDEEHH